MHHRSRQAVRAVLVTPDQRILLMRLIHASRPFWITPGGGIEAGESDAMAMTRELAEETGLQTFELGPCLWTRETTYTLDANTSDAVEVAQSERFYLVRTDPFEPSAAGMPPEAERDWFQGFEWHSLNTLRALTERVVPTGLDQHLEHLFVHGPPTNPRPIPR
ncbi:MAG: NUDIX domain-containing protein [Pseudomonadota bacterium]